MKPTSVDWTKNGLLSCITERSKHHENTSKSSVNITKPVSLDLGQGQLWNFIGNTVLTFYFGKLNDVKVSACHINLVILDQ